MGGADEFIEKGNSYLVKQQFKEAVKEFSNAINVNPDNGECYMRRAIAFTELEKKEEAIADLKKAADLNYKEAVGALKAYFDIDY